MHPPPPPPRRLRIVLAANTGYLGGLVVTVHSLLRHLASDCVADLTLLTDDFDTESEDALRRVAAATGHAHTLDIVRLGPDDLRDFPSRSGGSRLAYARLLCPRLIAEDRALYLDSDIVVGRDLSQLLDLPRPTDRWFYAVRDGCVGTFGLWWENIPYAELGIPADAHYFNSGVLWMDLAAWRRENVAALCADYARRYPDRQVFQDQSVLNAVLWNSWTPLERPWNCFPEHTIGRFSLYPLGRVRDTNLHYVFAKPWQQRHPWGWYYWEQMDQIAALVPPRCTVRPRWERKPLGRWAFIFGQRAYLHYGGFVKHEVLGALGVKSARRQRS